MIKGLKNSLKKISLGKLRADHETAAQAVADDQAARDGAALDAELAPDDSGAAKRLAAAEKQLAASVAREAALAGAIKAAEFREAQRAEKEAATALAARWDQVEAAAARRMEHARAAEKAITDLAEAWAGLEAEQQEILKAAPVRPDSGVLAGALMGFELTESVKLELVRRGFKWAGVWLNDPAMLKPLTEKIATGNRYLSSFRAKNE